MDGFSTLADKELFHQSLQHFLQIVSKLRDDFWNLDCDLWWFTEHQQFPLQTGEKETLNCS